VTINTHTNSKYQLKSRVIKKITGTGILALTLPLSIYGFSHSALAATIQPIVFFTGTNGKEPSAALIQGRDGNLYGTTYSGGTSLFYGTVFKVTPTGRLTTLANFNNRNGGNPQGELIQATDGNFYGTTTNGGSSSRGTVFRLTPTGQLTTLVNFNGTNGGSPRAGLIQARDGNFYGTTTSGGTNFNGTVFKLTPTGRLTTLANFQNRTGVIPWKLVQGRDGNFYGTTLGGGAGFSGTVFKVTPTGVLTTLVNFNYGALKQSDGVNPQGGLILGRDGNFYGTTSLGGANLPGGNGTVFRVTPSGRFTVLARFDYYNNGAFPFGNLTLGTDGNFYGTTNSGGRTLSGTVYRMTPSGGITVLAQLNRDTVGAQPEAGITQGKDGKFYGTTRARGKVNPSSSYGTIFKLSLP
jgi:uncharacterized repeat protein (TIGR03803 family)